MSFFSRSRRKKEKEDRFEADVRAAAKLLVAEEKYAKVQQEDTVIGQMRFLQNKIELCEKKLAKHEAEKREIMTQLLPYKQKNIAMPDALKRKLVRSKKDIQITTGHLAALESKLDGIKMAVDNQEVTKVLDDANKVVDAIAPSPTRVEHIIGMAQEQAANLEEANNAFIIGASMGMELVDDDDLEAQLAEYEVGHGITGEVTDLNVGDTTSLPLPKKIQRPENADSDEVELEQELKRLEMAPVM